MQHRPAADELESSVRKVREELLNLSYAADHDSIYDWSAVFYEQVARELKQWANTYKEAVEVCDLYLRREISLECLFYEFIKLELEGFLSTVQKYLSEELKQKFYKEEKSDDDDEDDEDSKS